MLLRWLVNQYLREAGTEKVRGVIADVAGRALATTDRSLAPGSRHPTTHPSPQDDYEVLPCDVAFIFALGIESGGLVDLLKSAETSRHKHGTEHAGKLGGREVVIVESGVGQTSAARATAETIKFYQPRWVVSAGFAGGLSEELRRGHVVMADEVVNSRGEALKTDLRIESPRTEEPKDQRKGLHIGRLLTVDSILREPAERRRFADEHQAVGCDMESFAVVEACRRLNVPCLAIRIISDAVDDELPPEVEHLLRQKSLAGKVGAAAGAVIKRLSAAKDLWKLREDALKASDRLAKFLVGVVEQLPNDQ
jgi:adenosylhomocysteine nucleosidase